MWGGFREFDELVSQKHGMTSAQLNHITEGLLSYFPPINALSTKKRAMLTSNRCCIGIIKIIATITERLIARSLI